MSTHLVSVTPIARDWPHPLGALSRGVQIVERPLFNEVNWRFWNLRRSEEETVLQRSHWLRIERECEWTDRALFNEMAEDLRTAMLGFQLWAPIGWDGLILDCCRTEEGPLTVECVHRPEAYATPFWGRMLDLRNLDPARLGQLVEGTLAAVESGCVPIVNPFRFLEIGIQTAINHRRAGAVLWMMGLDGLLAAERQVVFSNRLQKLLGKHTRIFPEDRFGRRPTYTVAELAANMFEFRSLIAHGEEILQKYREPIAFQFEPGELDYRAVEKWSRGTLMIESVLFALIATLRTVITDDLMERIRNQRAWKRWLDAPL
jgi:hypothetical protein